MPRPRLHVTSDPTQAPPDPTHAAACNMISTVQCLLTANDKRGPVSTTDTVHFHRALPAGATAPLFHQRTHTRVVATALHNDPWCTGTPAPVPLPNTHPSTKTLAVCAIHSSFPCSCVAGRLYLVRRRQGDPPLLPPRLDRHRALVGGGGWGASSRLLRALLWPRTQLVYAIASVHSPNGQHRALMVGAGGA